jgi:hypothetical protein
MKTKEFQRILIENAEHLQKDYISRFNAKIKTFEALCNYMKHFIPIEDKNEFTSEIYETFLNKFLKKNKDDFPKNSPINSMLNFMQVNTQKLQDLITEFQAIDFEENINFNAPELEDKDFGIYTETDEQNFLFFRLQNIITEISKLEALNKTILKAPLVQAFQFMLHYDFYTQQLKPNSNFILGKRIM